MVNVEGGWSQALESEWVRGGMMPLIGLAPDTFTWLTSILVVMLMIAFLVKL